MVGTAILTLFENRFFLMFARYHPWRRYRSIFLFINYNLAAFFFIPAYFAIPEQTEALQKVFSVGLFENILSVPHSKLQVLPKLPEVILNAPLFVLATDLNLVLLSVLFMAILLVTENAVFVILLYCKMKIRTRRMSTSQYTLNLQKKFLRAIYIQVEFRFRKYILLILFFPGVHSFSDPHHSTHLHVLLCSIRSLQPSSQQHVYYSLCIPWTDIYYHCLIIPQILSKSMLWINNL